MLTCLPSLRQKRLKTLSAFIFGSAYSKQQFWKNVIISKYCDCLFVCWGLTSEQQHFSHIQTRILRILKLTCNAYNGRSTVSSQKFKPETSLKRIIQWTLNKLVSFLNNEHLYRSRKGIGTKITRVICLNVLWRI